MTASTQLRPSVRAAFHALIDYAGLFPPAQLSMTAAQGEYEAARRGPHAWMLGRFIISAPLLTGSLAATLSEPLSVIVDPNVDALKTAAQAREEVVKIEALEIPLRKSISPMRKNLSRDEILDVIGALEADLSLAGMRDLPAFVEIPLDEPWRGMLADTMSTLARAQLAAKLRCGGIAAKDFPSVEAVVEFITAAHEARVPFKATAGLHHPVRHVDPPSGFRMHGFLNLLAAAALAPRVDAATLRRILAEEDANAFCFDAESFGWRGEHIGIEELTAMRRDAFVAYGSCSFAEPVEDLAALGMLPPV